MAGLGGGISSNSDWTIGVLKSKISKLENKLEDHEKLIRDLKYSIKYLKCNKEKD